MIQCDSQASRLNVARIDERLQCAILFPIDDTNYEINWIWDPIEQLKVTKRHVQWSGETKYELIDAGTWELTHFRPSQIPINHYKFRIGVSDEEMRDLQSDTVTLDTLKSRILGSDYN